MSNWQTTPGGLLVQVDTPKPPPPEPVTLDACPQCAAAFTEIGDVVTTCVGFFSPPGHDHDDNCVSSSATCANGHRTRFSVQRSCHACNWRGKTSCCNGDMPAKLKRWPSVTVRCFECGRTEPIADGVRQCPTCRWTLQGVPANPSPPPQPPRRVKR